MAPLAQKRARPHLIPLPRGEDIPWYDPGFAFDCTAGAVAGIYFDGGRLEPVPDVVQQARQQDDADDDEKCEQEADLHEREGE